MSFPKSILVTGGAGFIGSAFCRAVAADGSNRICVLDKLGYASTLSSLDSVLSLPNFQFVQGDICDAPLVADLLKKFQPDAIAHFAAESHVDRSIDDASDFIRSNIVGTHVLLDQAHLYWLSRNRFDLFRFLHISTDEVFGTLGDTGKFDESSPYDPRSPYSASKAASDHLVRAWWHTFGLPVLISNCSNNFGPYQFPEKLIPLMILNSFESKKLPVYGKGKNVRDWLYVDDHVDALRLILAKGQPGDTFTVGGNSERQNLDVVHDICDIVDELLPAPNPRRSLVAFVQDRPGHDIRYAINASRIHHVLGWTPKRKFEDALRATVEWYLENRSWWESIRSGAYRGERLGLDKHPS